MKSLLHQLAFGIWAIRPEAVEAYMPQVKEVLMGRQANSATIHKQTEEELMMEAGLCFYTADGRRMNAGVDEVSAEPGLVAVMNITGAMMKSDYCGAPGALRMSQWLSDFEATEEIAGVVLNIDSPGGSGYAMNIMAAQIESMSKPVVGLVSHGMACSAAYGTGAACDLLLTNSGMDEVGSIGTYVRLANWQGMWEKEGVQFHEIYATRSTEKNAWVREAFKADPKNEDDPHYKAIRTQYIDPFNEAFIAHVQKNRPGVKDANGALSGRVFMSADALTNGLIDSTGHNLDSAIAAVRELVTKNPN